MSNSVPSEMRFLKKSRSKVLHREPEYGYLLLSFTHWGAIFPQACFTSSYSSGDNRLSRYLCSDNLFTTDAISCNSIISNFHNYSVAIRDDELVFSLQMCGVKNPNLFHLVPIQFPWILPLVQLVNNNVWRNVHVYKRHYSGFHKCKKS